MKIDALRNSKFSFNSKSELNFHSFLVEFSNDFRSANWVIYRT